MSKPGVNRRARRMVEAAGVEPEADIVIIGFYANLPNVYRMNYYFWCYRLK